MRPAELLSVLIEGHRGLGEAEKAAAKEAAADLDFRLVWAETQIKQLRGMVGHLMHKESEQGAAVPSPTQDAPKPSPSLALIESQPVQQPGYGG